MKYVKNALQLLGEGCLIRVWTYQWTQWLIFWTQLCK